MRRTLALVLLLATPLLAQEESTSARLFVCYENAGCPPVGSEREAQAAVAPERKPFYRDGEWYAQLFVSGLMAGLDYKSTSDCFSVSPRCTEQTPGLGKNKQNRGQLLLIGSLSLVGQGAITGALWEHGSGKPIGWVGTSARVVLHSIHIRENKENADFFRKLP